MPLFALALNISWELVYTFVVEERLEKTVFAIWLLIDCGLVYTAVKFGKHEWSHSPAVARNLGIILGIMTVGAALGHWSFATWWIDNEIEKHEGKFYHGRIGLDITELGYWSALLC
jgi:hypothetical protein